MSPPETGIRSRPATQDDLPILWDFVAIAAYEPDADAAKAVPFVAAHLAGWKRPEDFGFIAERDGLAIGAAWARQFAHDEQPAFFVDERTPEVTIGVKPAIRGRGVGRMLLDAMLAEAARRGIGLCLNVRLVVPAKADFILSKALKSERADPARSRKPLGRVSGFVMQPTTSAYRRGAALFYDSRRTGPSRIANSFVASLSNDTKVSAPSQLPS